MPGFACCKCWADVPPTGRMEPKVGLLNKLGVGGAKYDWGKIEEALKPAGAGEIPLGPEELEKIQRYFDHTGLRTLSYWGLRGLFTALATVPHSVLPGQWIGEVGTLLPKQKYAQRELSFLMQLYNHVVHSSDDIDACLPRKDDLDGEHAVQDFANGYLIGLHTDADLADELKGRPEYRVLHLLSELPTTEEVEEYERETGLGDEDLVAAEKKKFHAAIRDVDKELRRRRGSELAPRTSSCEGGK